MKKHKNSKGRRYTCDVAFLQRMPAGIPGDISRKENTIVEARVYDATNPPAFFGTPLIVDATSKNVRKVLATDQVASAIYAFLVRPFPTSNANTTDGLGTSVPNTNFPANAMKRGYMNVLMQNSTAAALNGQVYVRVAATAGPLLQGGIEAAAAATVTSPAIVGTGTGTIAATVGNAALIKPGTYVLTLLATSATAAVQVVDPDGIRLADAKVGTAYSDQGLNFTITNGGTMTIGDSFSPVVTAQNLPVPGAFFMGPADASGNTEIAYKS